MLKAEKISKFYWDTLFEDVSFVLGNKEKVGLIGLNGCGKTTLLRIISGLENPDKGRIELVREKVGYLPQEFSFEKDKLVGEFLESLVEDPHTEMYKVDKVLSKLGLEDIDVYQYLENLSEGQKLKLKLVELLMKDSTVLLLDEPTNHLDIEGILWFEEFVKQFRGICIIISHDREFLNNIVNKIFEIDEKKLLVFEGNYDDYLNHKQKYIEKRRQAYVLQEKKRLQLEELLHSARKIKSGQKRSKAVSAAKHRMEREVLRNEVSLYQKTEVSKFGVEGAVHNKKKIVEVKDLTFGYSPNKNILKNTIFSIYGKEKVWFYGKNGIGKTTLINLIIGKLKPLKGEVLWGENINWTIFSQNQKHLNMDQTVEDYFLTNTGIPYHSSFKILEKFLFPKELRNYKLKQLSPGQRARISFAVFAQHEYNFLILDEPTNHLDIQTKEIIEDALLEFKGAVLLISHDRYFVRSVGIDRVITLEDRKVAEKVGVFSDGN